MSPLTPKSVQCAARARRFSAALLVVAGLCLGGCASTRQVVPSLPIVEVEAGSQHARAQLAAAEHDGDFVLNGVGDSMAPYLRRSSAIVVHPTSFFMLRPGATVVYRNAGGRLVAHVLVSESNRGWEVQGANNATADAELVTPANLVGIVRVAYAPRSTQAFAVNGSSAGYPDRIALLH